MVLTLSNEIDDFSNTMETPSNVTELNAATKSDDSFEENENWQDESEIDSNESQFEGEPTARDFSQNQVSLTFSWSLMNQLRYLARTEGIPVEDLLIELVAESVTKRAFEDQNKPLPSHLMTRNGYVHSSNDGNSNHLQQPQMSYHSTNRVPQPHRNKPAAQSRNNQYNNTQRYQGAQNRNYQGNNRNPQNGNAISFRQNSNLQNPQQRHNQRFATDAVDNQQPPSRNKKY